MHFFFAILLVLLLEKFLVLFINYFINDICVNLSNRILVVARGLNFVNKINYIRDLKKAFIIETLYLLNIEIHFSILKTQNVKL